MPTEEIKMLENKLKAYKNENDELAKSLYKTNQTLGGEIIIMKDEIDALKSYKIKWLKLRKIYVEVEDSMGSMSWLDKEDYLKASEPLSTKQTCADEITNCVVGFLNGKKGFHVDDLETGGGSAGYNIRAEFVSELHETISELLKKARGE